MSGVPTITPPLYRVFFFGPGITFALLQGKIFKIDILRVSFYSPRVLEYLRFRSQPQAAWLTFYSPRPESIRPHSTYEAICCQFSSLVKIFPTRFSVLGSPRLFSNVLRAFFHRQHLKQIWFASSRGSSP